MYNYPFSGSSKRYYQYQPYYYPHRTGSSLAKLSTESVKSPHKNPQNVENDYIPKSELNTTKEKDIKSQGDVLFEIFGIKLYFDDVLLICLIFFLYNEGVQDQYLFIVLILLLIS